MGRLSPYQSSIEKKLHGMDDGGSARLVGGHELVSIANRIVRQLGNIIMPIIVNTVCGLRHGIEPTGRAD